MSERETALEEGWLLAELEQHFGYGLDALARRFDRSVSWVSQRLAQVELLPESVQQQVRVGRRQHLAVRRPTSRRSRVPRFASAASSHFLRLRAWATVSVIIHRNA